MLGLLPIAAMNTLMLDPVLPVWIPELVMRDLRVGDAKVTFASGVRRMARPTERLCTRKARCTSCGNRHPSRCRRRGRIAPPVCSNRFCKERTSESEVTYEHSSPSAS
jgi:hypothetical protein